MVKINQIQAVSDGKKGMRPVTHVHDLMCIKPIGNFETDRRQKCYVTKYDGGRFAVFTASGVANSQYAVCESEDSLHEHFDEHGI